MCPFPLSVRDGHSCAHLSVAKRHLVRNAQPEGMCRGLGTSPSRMIRRELLAILGSGIGTAESRDCVYGDLGIRDRNRGEQGLRVGVDGALIELIRVRCLYYSSKVHNSDSVRNMSDNQKVVRDEEIGNAQLLLQLFKHIDDLRLDGNVQRGYSLVADDESGIYCQRSRNTDTLSLTAGELVDISCRVLCVQSDQFHEAEDLLSALCFGGIEFMDVQGSREE